MLDYFNASAQADFTKVYTDNRVVARIPTEVNCTYTGCGWDPVSGSGKLLGCPTCHGKGKTQTWITYAINCRLQWTDMIKLSYPNATTGVELGDCVIAVAWDNTDVLDSVMMSERAYLQMDNRTVRPTTKQETRVGELVREIEYVCKSYNPRT